MKLLVPKVLLLVITAAGSQLMLTTAYAQDAGHDSMQSQSAQAAKSVDKGEEGVAVKGYDVVAYFDQQKPMKGDPKYSYEYNGTKYLFASTVHMDEFEKNPEAYLPQYGGYCTVGTAMGHKAQIDPESWAVVDGKLYLNSGASAQQYFDKDRKGVIKRADANWANSSK